jgi:hypothetical protein
MSREGTTFVLKDSAGAWIYLKFENWPGPEAPRL